MKIKKFLKRDVCKECDYYHKENGTCQSKKCVTGGSGYVGFIERKFCTPYKENIDKKVNKATKEDFIQYAKDEYGIDVSCIKSDNPDTFDKLFGQKD